MTTHFDKIEAIIMIVLGIMSLSVMIAFFTIHTQNHNKILNRIEQSK